MNPLFEPVLAELSERHRDEVLAAFAAVEHSPNRSRRRSCSRLRDATLRRSLDEVLHRVGRTLIPVGPAWTSGYRDDVAAELARPAGTACPPDRAVLVLVLIHSVAIPRSRGTMHGDMWTSGQPTDGERAAGGAAGCQPTDVRLALGHLRAAGLIQLAAQRAGTGQSAAYLPGPQLHRLSAAARRRLTKS